MEIYNPNNNDFHYTVDDLMSYYSAHPVDSILLINPDNPSGNFIPKSDVLTLAEWCSLRSIKLVLDESFVDFSTGYPNNTLLSNEILDQYPNLIVVKSISKSFGVPGLRLGVLASSDINLIDTIKKDVSIWNLNSFAEFYMQIFSKYESDYHKACHKFATERERFWKELNTISYLRVIPSQANYFLCEVLPPFTSHNLTVKLLNESNILIKDCSTKKAFGGRSYIRIAIRNREDNKRLIQKLKEL